MRCWITLVLVAAGSLWLGKTGKAAEPEDASTVPNDIIQYLDSIRPDLVSINQDIWSFAELGLQEYRSAARLTGVLKKAGFKVKEGVSGMPTAFVAEYGKVDRKSV